MGYLPKSILSPEAGYCFSAGLALFRNSGFRPFCFTSGLKCPIIPAIMKTAELANAIFDDSVAKYHISDNIDAPCQNPHKEGSLEAIFFEKNWVDAVQWHLEDIIRDPEIDPVEALALKRRIDASNQVRTDMVEEIDSWFRSKFSSVKTLPEATINTESPAWALDRLSILALKIWHMKEQALRTDAEKAHTDKCRAKLDVLLEQRKDLTEAIDTLLDDIEAGRKYMKVYRQMKMYNDPSTNPVLYGKKG